MMALGAKIRGITTGILLFLSSLLGIVFMTGWMLPVLFIKPSLYRVMVDHMIGFWKWYAASLLELFLGIRMVISGDQIRPNERCLLMMNHRTRLDWMYLWSLLVRQSGVKTEKIILKEPLKNIPGPGWAMQAAGFIFIRRKWEEDKVILTKMLDYFNAVKHKTQILIFPEGTDLTSRTKLRSDEFARKNNLKPYDYVLHPRTTGFTFLAKHMQMNNQLDAVYDISIAYPFNFPQNEPQLLLGNFPKEVHFHVTRHSSDKLPVTEEGLAEWCKSRWEVKEERLKAFAADRHFRDNKDDEDSSSKNDSGNSSSPAVEETVPSKKDATLLLKIAFTYWTVFVVTILLLLMFSSMARWFLLFQIIFYMYMSYRGGFELFQAEFMKKVHGLKKLN